MFFKKKSEFVFPNQIEINGKNFEIEVIFIKKRSSSCSIKENTLSFRLSSFLSEKKAQEHFKELLEKMYKKVEKLNPDHFENNFDNILEKEEFIFAGDIFKIEYSKFKGVKLKENTFYINARLEKEDIEKAIIKLLIKKYTPRLESYLNFLNEQTYNYKIKDFKLKHVKSKWGHCTHDNSIMLNIKLLNAPKEVLDYVIFHELSHIVHKNHSMSFWNEVTRFCPNYKMLRNSLKKTPPKLFIENV